MGRVTQQATAAGMSVKQLEDLTVNGVVAAKALGVQWQVAARDIDQALQGRLSIRDELTTKLLAATGFVGEDGRKRFNQLSKERRAAALMEALTAKQITQLAEAQAQSFQGRVDRLRDSMQQLIMRVGKPLFDALGNAIRDVNKWLDQNRAKINAIADTVGGALGSAFGMVRDVLRALLADEDRVIALLTAIVGLLGVAAIRSMLALLPLMRVLGLIAGAIWIFRKLRDHIGDVGAALASAFAVAGVVLLTRKVRELAGALRAARTAAGAGSVAGAAVNAASSIGLGPAGAAQAGGKATKGARGIAAGGAVLKSAGGVGLVFQLADALSGGRMFESANPEALGNVNDVIKRAEALKAKYAMTPTVNAAPSINNSTIQQNSVDQHVTLNITGVRDAADVKAVIKSEMEKFSRHAMDAFSGGSK